MLVEDLGVGLGAVQRGFPFPASRSRFPRPRVGVVFFLEASFPFDVYCC